MKLVCCLVFLLLPSVGLCIERPRWLGNYLKRNTGEYLYAEDNPSLDFRLRNNFAVEFWYKLESVPEKPFQQRALLAKPGSYAFVILAEVVIDTKDGFPQERHIPTLYIMTRTHEGGFDVGVLGGISPGVWYHFGFETRLEGGVRRSFVYYNGNAPSNLNLPDEVWCNDTDSRFYVGYVPQDAVNGLAIAADRYGPFVSAPIYLDEVRLSIAPVGKPRIAIRPKPTPRTMALWRFSEGTDASKYLDSAGANTLFRQPRSV